MIYRVGTARKEGRVLQRLRGLSLDDHKAFITSNIADNYGTQMPDQTVKAQIPSECEWGSFTFVVLMKKFEEILERLDKKILSSQKVVLLNQTNPRARQINNGVGCGCQQQPINNGLGCSCQSQSIK